MRCVERVCRQGKKNIVQYDGVDTADNEVEVGKPVRRPGRVRRPITHGRTLRRRRREYIMGMAPVGVVQRECESWWRI